MVGIFPNDAELIGLAGAVTLLGVIDDLDGQLAPLERELRPLARADERAQLLMTIPRRR